jgi:hypothetical protein
MRWVSAQGVFNYLKPEFEFEWPFQTQIAHNFNITNLESK